jgi:hypothetical protein
MPATKKKKKKKKILTRKNFGGGFLKITKPGLVPEIWNNPAYYPIKVCLDPGTPLPTSSPPLSPPLPLFA